MKDLPDLLSVGLTGGICSGKTTLARMLESRGCRRLDADGIAHDLLKSGLPAWREVLDRFGREVLGPDGEIDRSVLGRRVFADPAERRALEEILHPRILEREEATLRSIAAGSGPVIVVVEAALMVEVGSWKRYDRLVVVHCPGPLQLQRLEARGLGPREANARLDAQMPIEDKIALADYAVDNSGSLKELRIKATALHAMLSEDLRAKREGLPPSKRRL